MSCWGIQLTTTKTYNMHSLGGMFLDESETQLKYSPSITLGIVK